jgi:DNA-binding transcriptional LysR family regulator
VLDFDELHCFIQVCRTHSLTAAASCLGVSRSKISRTLSRLEERLGVKLLERSTHHLALTGDGEIFLKHGQLALEYAEKAERSITDRTTPRGRLRIGSSLGVMNHLLGLYLGEFLNRYPKLSAHLQPSAGIRNPLEANLDVLILAERIEDSGLLIKHLGTAPAGIYASPAYLDAHGTPESPSSLRRHDWITPKEVSEVWSLHRDSETREVLAESRASAGDPVVRLHLAVSGIGIAILPEKTARLELQEGTLVRVLPEWHPDALDLYAVYSSHLHENPRLAVFLAWLIERIPTLLE